MNQVDTNHSRLELLLFTVDVGQIKEAENAGIDGIIVDWENHEKKSRQYNFDTQINHHDFDDLCRVRDTVKDITVICRINGFSEALTYKEIDQAVTGGAQEIFLPMVRSVSEVKSALNYLGDRADMSILVETQEALGCLSDLASLPLKRVYVGLNDLHIQQNTPNIFYPLVNDTVGKIRTTFGQPVGVGGLTMPSSGEPIRSEFLIREYARLNINFSFLRRTFLRDCREISMKNMVEQIRTSYAQAIFRTEKQQNDDFQVFESQVFSWKSNLSCA